MSTEPRSPSEAVAAVDAEREHLDEPDRGVLDAEASEHVEEPVEERPESNEEPPEVEERDEELEASVEDVGYDPPPEQSAQVEHGMDDLRTAFGASEPVEPEPVEEMPADVEQPAPTAGPTLDDLRAFLLTPNDAVAVDLGPMTRLGERDVPAYLLELQRRGYIRSWE